MMGWRMLRDLSVSFVVAMRFSRLEDAGRGPRVGWVPPGTPMHGWLGEWMDGWVDGWMNAHQGVDPVPLEKSLTNKGKL